MGCVSSDESVIPLFHPKETEGREVWKEGGREGERERWAYLGMGEVEAVGHEVVGVEGL